ncbi:MAG: ATP-binding protein [Streptosporangiaceae bacterium]
MILTGPRTVGKSTLLAALAAEFDRPVLDLDRPDARAAAASDPSFIVSGPGPVLIDEFQHVPEILDAIKAELNTDTRPGRYVLTGSTRYSILPQAAQSLTGRAHVINVLPLSQGELYGSRENFIGRLWTGPATLPEMSSHPVTRDEYVDRILAGGFPMILQRLTTRARTSWFADYVNLVVMRDVLDVARVRQREALPRLLRQFAAQTGQMLNISKAGQAVGLESSTANRYATLLEAAFMIQRLPAWGTTLGKRIAAYPKVHVIDSGLAGWLLGLSAAKVGSRDPAVLTGFGHLVETFAVEEILKQVSWSEEVVTAAYFRTQDGDEVDLVLETWDGRVVGFEVKAGSRVQDADLSGLRLLRDRLGERFVAGYLLNLGELAYRKEERIMVMPLSGLWSLASSANSARSVSLSHAQWSQPALAGQPAFVPGDGVVQVAPGAGRPPPGLRPAVKPGGGCRPGTQPWAAGVPCGPRTVTHQRGRGPRHRSCRVLAAVRGRPARAVPPGCPGCRRRAATGLAPPRAARRPAYPRTAVPGR